MTPSAWLSVCAIAATRSAPPRLTPEPFKEQTMTAYTIDTNNLWALIKDIRFAMFTSRHGDGQIDSPPMTTQNSPTELGVVLRFFMSRSGAPVADLEDPH